MTGYAALCLGLILALAPGCAKKESTPDPVLARVGSTIITVKDLNYRAAFTIRPGNIKTPNAVLNNLIAEKILAVEAGDTNKLVRSEAFQGYIRGIREQAMREALYNELAVKTVQVDTAEIANVYRLSQRVYDVEFFTINNPEIQQRVDARLKSDPASQSAVFDELKQQGQSGVKTVNWRDPDDDNIHLSLFSKSLTIGEVIGPVRVGESQTIMMRIADVKIEPLIGPEDQGMRRNEVREKLADLKARIGWESYKSEMMRGKKIQFEKDVFDKLTKWFMTAYAAKQAESSSETGEHPPINLNNPEELDALLDQPFFKLDDAVWTVGDFKRAVMSHPLVYPQTDIRPSRFAEHFKRAVGDLLVDHFLNREAYRRGLDKDPKVRHKGEVWSDALMAKYELEDYLKRIDVHALQEKDPSYLGMRAVDEYLAALRPKYQRKVWIDEDALKKVKLTNMPLLATRKGMPYPLAVPGFSVFTTADTLIFNSKKF